MNTTTPDSQRSMPGSTHVATGRSFDEVPSTAHLLEPLLARVQSEPDHAVVARRHGDGFVDVTAGELLDRVRQLAKGLIAHGVNTGDRVALMSRTRLEWLELDYAILAIGAVTVPVYETSAADQLHWILADSGAVAVILETPEMRRLLGQSTADRPWREAFVIDEGGLDELVRRGHGVPDADIDARIAALRAGDVATIIYTSGTTGRPKGCVLTHANLRANVLQIADAVHGTIGPADRSLLFLPLAHAFSRTIMFVGAELGIKGVFATSVGSLGEELPLAQPTMLVAVPRVFEKAFETARQRAGTGARRRVFDRSVDVATRYAQQRANGNLRVWTRTGACAVQPPRLQKAASRVRRISAVRLQRRERARRATHTLLRRHRHSYLRGLWPHRDKPRPDRQPAGCVAARNRRAAARGNHDTHSRRRRGPGQRTAGVRWLLAQPGGVI